MRAHLPSPVVDITEGMSDLDVGQESDAKDDNSSVGNKDTRKPRKKRRKWGNRRGGKGKKAQDLEKLNKFQDGEVGPNARHEGKYDSP
jgi:hypothetical protein